SASVAAAVVAVPLLVGLLRDGARDAASSQVGAERAGAVGLIGDDLVGSSRGPALAGAWDADAFQDGACAGAVVALARGQQDRERAPLAVAGEVDLGSQSASGSTEGLIVLVVRTVG